MKIGKLVFEDPVICLAPMAGISSVTFRGICHEFGSSYAPTELVSARSIVFNGIDKSFRFMETDKKNEGITCIQLFGNDPSDFSEAVKKIFNDPRLHDTDIIDINMGCPVPKVVKTGAGSALMKTPSLAAKILESTVRAAEEFDVPVTVKTRTGWDPDDNSGASFAGLLAQSGASAVCVHGRTRDQMYHGEASIEKIALACDRVKSAGVPFFANGDITDGDTAAKMIASTGADGIMIGRAARGNPWIFREVRAFLEGKDIPAPPTAEDKCAMLLRELKGTAGHISEATAVKEMRSVMPHYIKGMRGAAAYKVRLCQAVTIEETEEILKEMLNTCSTGTN